MPMINGTTNNETLQGTNEDDTINAGNGQDLVSGEGGTTVFWAATAMIPFSVMWAKARRQAMTPRRW